MDTILKNSILILIILLILLMTMRLVVRISRIYNNESYEKKDRPKFLYKGQGRIRTGYRS